MELRYSGGNPIIRCNKSERRHLMAARDSLRALAHVEPTSGELIEYLDGLVKRIDTDGIVQLMPDSKKNTADA